MKTIGTTCLLLLVSASVSGGQPLEGLAAEALDAEKAIWQSEIDGDVAGFGSRLATDFLEVTTGSDSEPSITPGRQAAVASFEESLKTMAFGAFEFESPHARVLGNTVILAFRFTQVHLPRSAEPPVRVEGVATSIWVKDSGKWQNVHFHMYSRLRSKD